MNKEQVHQLAVETVNALVIHYYEPVAGTVVAGLDDLGYWVADNGEEIKGLTKEQAVEIIVENLTQDEEKQANKYFLNEEYLGSEATREDAETLIKILQKKGYDVEYGDPNLRRLPSNWDYDAAISFDNAVIEGMAQL